MSDNPFASPDAHVLASPRKAGMPWIGLALLLVACGGTLLYVSKIRAKWAALEATRERMNKERQGLEPQIQQRRLLEVTEKAQVATFGAVTAFEAKLSPRQVGRFLDLLTQPAVAGSLSSVTIQGSKVVLTAGPSGSPSWDPCLQVLQRHPGIVQTTRKTGEGLEATLFGGTLQ